jgi:CRISPR-associated protein Cmr1
MSAMLDPLNTAPPTAMKILRYQLTFLTPAFLGDAEQNGRWRTPPFKAQLRQWWRLVYAADHGFNVDLAQMRRDEGLLFGNAWLSHREGGREVADHSKSLVRLRLSRWDKGQLAKWKPLAQVRHPEVRFAVGSDLYLGYGPLILPRGAREPALKKNAAIQAGESAEFSVAVPESDASQSDASRVERALALMHRFGTVGGRSRNGWGSYALAPLKGKKLPGNQTPTRPWKDCLQFDWPHAIGCDEKGPLIWQTEPLDDWKAVIKRLAELKIGLRTQLRFTTGHNAPHVEDRLWLSYPVTNHSVKAWGRNARLPNQLRFKVRNTDNGKLVGVIFHVPHLPPPAFEPNGAAVEKVWQKVLQFLNTRPGLTRIDG